MLNSTALLGPLHCKKLSLVYLRKIDKNVSPDIKNFIIKNAAIVSMRYNCSYLLKHHLFNGQDTMLEFGGTSCLLYYHTKDETVLNYIKQYLSDSFSLVIPIAPGDREIEQFIDDVRIICSNVD